MLAWGESRPDLSVRGVALVISALNTRPPLLRRWPDGTVEVKVNAVRKIDAAWNDDVAALRF